MDSLLQNISTEILSQITSINFAELIPDINIGEVILDLIILFLIFIPVWIVFTAIKYVIFRWIFSFLEHTKTKVDDVIAETLGSISWIFYVAIAVQIWSRLIELNNLLFQIFQVASLTIIFFYGVLILSRIVNILIDELLVKHQKNVEDDAEDSNIKHRDLGIPKVDETVSRFIKVSINVLLWIVAVLILIQNIGLNVTALVGGLGIAGIAIGFAVQSILQDIISFFTIYFDKPFQPGDFIITNQDKGTVKRIGIKSTEIKTLHGQQLVIPNTELVSSRINNYGLMETRRKEIQFGVLYETPKDKLKKIPDMIKEIIDNIDQVEFGRCHHKHFGDSAMEYVLVYTIQDADYELYMNKRQEINFAIMDKFEEEGIEFAYPTQKIFTKNLD